MTLARRGPSPHYPVLDAPRHVENTEFNRTILDTFGFVEPYIGEMDSWTSVPLRLTHNDAAGLQLEVGPYDLSRADIAALREAIFAYDAAAAQIGN